MQGPQDQVAWASVTPWAAPATSRPGQPGAATLGPPLWVAGQPPQGHTEGIHGQIPSH